MKLTVPTTLLFVLVPTVNGQEDGFFVQLINSLLRPLVQGVCDTAQSGLGLDDVADCTCDAAFRGFFQGIDGSLSCATEERQCLLPPNLYCADGSIDITVGGGFFTDTEIEADITGCFQVESGLPGGLLSVEDVCFTFIPDGLRLESCTASIGGVACRGCDICDSGIDFTFDCSNVDLLPLVPGFLKFPNITTCLGLSLIPAGDGVSNRLV